MEEHDKQIVPDQSELKELYTTISSKVTDDPMLLKMVDLLFEDPLLKPAILARLLGASIKEVNNAQKRLRRRLQDLRQALKKA